MDLKVGVTVADGLFDTIDNVCSDKCKSLLSLHFGFIINILCCGLISLCKFSFFQIQL